MTSSRPSIAELRAVCQPQSVIGRPSAEHWAGRWYMRRLSIHVTRLLLNAPVSPNGLTVLMMAVGVVGAVAAAWPGVGTAVAAAVLIQAYLLLDCVDGEVARWRRVTSAAGVFLDRLGHYVAEAALLVAIGLRADGGPAELGLWSWVGAVAAVVALLGKTQNDLVAVARSGAGLGELGEGDEQPSRSALRGVRGLVHRLPVHRMVGAIELSLLLVVAAVIDAVTGELVATRVLILAAAVVGSIVALLHPVFILSSRRLR